MSLYVTTRPSVTKVNSSFHRVEQCAQIRKTLCPDITTVALMGYGALLQQSGISKRFGALLT